jgi:DNA-binding Lrp family transcriptional regulator
MVEGSLVDEKDIKIIEILSANARSPLRDIAKKVGLSPSSVRNRMQRLIDEGVVRKYTLDVDHKKVGLGIEILVLLSVRPGFTESILQELNGCGEVANVFRTSGPVNLVCLARVGTMDQLNVFITNRLESIDGIENINTLLIFPKNEEE